MTQEQWQINEINKLSLLVNNSPSNKNKVLLLSACLNFISLYGEQDLFTNCKISLYKSREHFNYITIYKL